MQKLTLKEAIHEKCFDCIYDHRLKGSKWLQTENCIAIKCALWEHRPVTEATENERKQAKLGQ